MYYIESKDLNFLVDISIEFLDAASAGDIFRIRTLIDEGIHPDTQGPRGWTALRKAAVKSHCTIAFELLKRGANVDACNYTGQTALMMACAYGHAHMVSLLLFYGANPNLANCGSKTPLMIAASGGYTRIVGILIDIQPRVDLNKIDRNGRNALDMAFAYGHNSIAKMLIAAGGPYRPVRPSHQCYTRHTALQPLNAGGCI